jgi:acyl-CoA reductase-like NAD-dependent aldehyde dehydrogenase
MSVLLNFIDGALVSSTATEYVNVLSPGTNLVLAQVPLSNEFDLNVAVDAANVQNRL